MAGVVLALGTKRVRSDDYATSRRNAHRVAASAGIEIDGVEGELVDISVGGSAARFPLGSLPNVGLVDFGLPGMAAAKMMMSRVPQQDATGQYASLQVVPGDWDSYRAASLWLFHTRPARYRTSRLVFRLSRPAQRPSALSIASGQPLADDQTGLFVIATSCL